MILALLASLAFGDEVNGPCFDGGPAIAVPSESTAYVYCRAQAASVYLQYRPHGSGAWTSLETQTPAAAPWTTEWVVSGLSADTLYDVKIQEIATGTHVSSVVTFHTAPASTTVKDRVEIALFADAFQSTCTGCGGTFQAAAARGPDFSVIMGDWDHDDPADLPTPITVANWRAVHYKMYGQYPVGQEFATYIERNGIPFDYIWSDHDYCNNNSDSTCPYQSYARQAYDEYIPHEPFPESGAIYHSKRWGKNVELFELDTRWYRIPDAPMLTCSPDSTMLGSVQKAWLIEGLLNSDAIFKVIVLDEPVNPSVGKEDSMFSFLGEWEDITKIISDYGITGTVVVDAGLHSVGLIDDGTAGGGLPEMSSPCINCDMTGCTNGGTYTQCGRWSVPYAEVHPHAGFGYLEITHNAGTGADVLTMLAISNTGVVRRSLPVTP